MKMQFAVGNGHERVDEVAEHARVAEESGFGFLHYGDSQVMHASMYVNMTIAALNTRRIQIGHGVTVPTTRHPAVTANDTATLNELTGGRIFLGIGAGGSTVNFLGMKGRPLQELRDTIGFIKGFMSGEEVEWNGVKMHSDWARHTVPVYVAAAGPKVLQLAGELGDAIMPSSNANPVVTKWRMEQIEKGALKVGRDPSKIDVWARGMIYVTDSKEAAQPEVAGYAANAATGLARFLGRRDLSPELADLRQRLEREHPGLLDDCKRVGDVRDTYQIERVDTPSARQVTQRIIDATQLCGTVEEICEKIDKLGQLGVKTIGTVTYSIFDKKGMMWEIGDKIMPHFRN